MKLRYRIEFTRAYISATNLQCTCTLSNKNVRGNRALKEPLEEQDNQLIPNKVAFRLVSAKTKATITTEKQTASGKHVRAMNTPFQPHVYIVKLGFAGVNLFFLFLLQNIDCGYLLEPPCQCGSYVYPPSMF